jgi:hypothetical protein
MAFVTMAAVTITAVTITAVTIAPVVGTQRVVSAVRVAGNDPADRPLDRVDLSALEQYADPIGHEASHDRPDERAVLEDLDQPLEGDLQAVANNVRGAGQRQVDEEEEGRHP